MRCVGDSSYNKEGENPLQPSFYMLSWSRERFGRVVLCWFLLKDLFSRGLIAEEVLCRCYETLKQRTEGVQKAPDHLCNSGEAVWGSSRGVYHAYVSNIAIYV